jgi:hypothetical protein
MVFLYSSIWYLTIGIIALFSPTKMGNFFLFCKFFFRNIKKGHETLDKPCIFFCGIFKKWLNICIPLVEKTNFKKNRLKRNLRGQIIIIFKSFIFQGLSADGHVILLIFVALGAKFEKQNYRSEFIFRKKNHLNQSFESEYIVEFKIGHFLGSLCSWWDYKAQKFSQGAQIATK